MNLKESLVAGILVTITFLLAAIFKTLILFVIIQHPLLGIGILLSFILLIVTGMIYLITNYL